MNIADILANGSFDAVTGRAGLTKHIHGVYAGDLLSWVMGRAKKGDIWVTIQGHINIVAVALLAGVSCIIVAEGAAVEPDTVRRAVDEEISILTTPLPTYDVCVLLAEKIEHCNRA